MRITFLGDSITASGRWQEVIDFAEVECVAVPGASTDATLAALPTILAQSPEILSLLIGTNDFGNPAINRSGLEVGAQIQAIVSSIKNESPRTTVVLHTILPRGIEANGVDLRKRVIAANHFIKEKIVSEVILIDLWPHFVGSDGISLADKYSCDDEPILRLHLNQGGYAKWESLLLPVLRELINP